eukprot:COSAG01_NODE_69400_length_261_cov_0.962963_1_plen_64_part_10
MRRQAQHVLRTLRLERAEHECQADVDKNITVLKGTAKAVGTLLSIKAESAASRSPQISMAVLQD